MSDFMLTIHALALLSHREEQLSSTQIAANACVNPVQIRRALSPCVRAGIVTNTPGSKGGYSLARPAQQITLQELAEITRTRVTHFPKGTGNADAECLISSGMGVVAHGLGQKLSELSANYLRSITLSDIEAELQSHAQSSQLINKKPSRK